MEIWDVYDINRNRIEGRTSVRGSDDMTDNEFHLVVFSVVCDSEGRLLCSMRDRNKMFGGTWEFCGGSALSGETSRQAAERELLEETGLDVKNCPGRIIAQNTKYWKGSNWFYDKKRYLVIALSPVIIWGVVLSALCVVIPRDFFWSVYFIQIMNISGAAGDLYVTYKMLRLPPDILVRDTGTSMEIFSRSTNKSV